MRELLETIDEWRADGRDFGRAVLIRSFGSAPRPEGATLLADDQGRVAGSVSGGCVEGAAVDEIARARRGGYSRVVRFGISDETAWDVGLACGSTIDVLIEPLVRTEAVEAARAASGIAIVTPLPAGSPTADGSRDVLSADGPVTDALVIEATGAIEVSTGSAADDAILVDAALDLSSRRRSATIDIGDRQYFIETFPRPARVVVFGATQSAIPLVRMAHELGYRAVIADARAAFATKERFPHADELLVGWPDEIAERLCLAPDDSVVVMTHDPKLDEPAIVLATRAGCRYVGAMGSRKTQAARRERLLASGLSEADLAKLKAPIGLDLGGKEPAEMALAILAEIVAQRNAASAVPLSNR